MRSESEIFSAMEAAGQSQVLRFWNQLDAVARRRLLSQLDELDLPALTKAIEEYVLRRPEVAIPDDLAPAAFFPASPATAADKARYAAARARGEELLRAGAVSCLTVAGGQGTRLGFDGPKGTYPIGPVTGRTLFEYFAGAIKRASFKYGRPVTWYVMTSLLNREATERFFKEHDYLGLAPEQVFFFTQGTMPAIGYDGKLLLSAPDSLALSPNGHGGTLLALEKSGALVRMKRENVRIISYCQVDNPLVPLFDPLFIGLHDLEGSEMSAIMLAKTCPEEKLGNFCVSQGRTQIIEYSDLPSELANRRNPDGSLAFVAGSPAIHMIERSFVERLTAGGTLRLPWHRADKKIPCLDAAGHPVKPESPNGVKLESFVFDALPLARKVMILEGVREDVFAPTKNATGVDSAESCRAMLSDRNHRWLRAAGAAVPECVMVEIAPDAALDAADFADYVSGHPVHYCCESELVIGGKAK